MKYMLKTLLALLLFAGAVINKAEAQFSDNFNDGDFTNNPAWTGGVTDFVINTAQELQSNNTTANSTFYLSTPSTKATEAEWTMDIRLTFNTSSANYVDIYLIASADNVSDPNTTGYFVRLGNTTDEISLYIKNAGGAITKLIDGADGVLNASSNTIRLKVTRDINNIWSLNRDLTGTGNAFVLEGTVTDATYTTSSAFGILVKQSTASFFQRHFFDNISVQAFVPDLTPPAIASASPTSTTMLDVLFNEPVEQVSAETLGNYAVNNGIGNPVSANRDAANPALVHLTFATPFPNGVTCLLTASNINDNAGNTLTSGTVSFNYYIAQRYDLVIDELMPDPNPVVALPDAEYLEIKNTTNKTLNLQGCRLISGTSISADFPSYQLPADSFIIITGTSSAGVLAPYGRVMGITSFPALSNDGATVSLISKEGIVLHSVSYNSNWYQSDIKKNGGWSLEMIDTKNPCGGANNWRASNDARGGSPGSKNSVDAVNPDQTAPIVMRAAAIDSVTVIVTFSESVDSLKGATAGNYSIDNGIGNPVSAEALRLDFSRVQLNLSPAKPLSRDVVYTITANGISDCSGNVITANTARFGLAGKIDSFDIVVNEILFDPKPSGVDYVELYNRSAKILDLKDLSIATRSSTTNTIGSITSITPESVLLFPGDYYVLSPGGDVVKQNYIAKNPSNFIDVALPSFANDKGTVVLINTNAQIVDELSYNAQWHFALLDNVEGISLERIDYNKPTQDQQNWHSAASSAGYGTPSYQNSQYRMDISVAGEMTVVPKIFSPDNDGVDDFTTINYQISETGFVANISIFDAAGRPVRVLAQNATLAQKGSFRWDGLNDKKAKVSTGSYVVFTEMFNTQGKKRTFKNVVVVTSRF